MEQIRPYPIPANDSFRAAAVAELDAMRFADDPFFTHVTDMVKALFDVPVAFVSLFTEDAQCFLRCQGLDIPGTPRTHSLCAFTVAERRTIVIPDAQADARSERHPVVTQMGLRFSASAPVILSNGFCMGTVCGVDLQPKAMPAPAAIAQLEALAAMIARFYEAPREPDPGHAARMRAIAEQAQQEFLLLVGHELRTPLNAIHGMAQLLDPADEAEREILTALGNATEHLHEVICNVLDLTELSSGDVRLEEASASLATLAGSALAPHRKLAEFRDKRLWVDIPDDLPPIRVDPARFSLALSCIAGNCVLHGGPNAWISARVNADGTVTLLFEDDGSGIPAERQHDIWTVFRVGADIHTRAADGLGLGLPLSRRIVELHGGEIAMDRDGGRLAVRIRLPHWRVARSADA